MRGNEQRVVARVNRQLVDAHRRQIGLEAAPRGATIERQKDAGLRADVEHVGIARVFSERLHDFGLERHRQRRERRAVVRADPQVGREVIQAVIVDRHVHRRGIKARRDDSAHERVSRREARQVFRDVRPRRAAVLRHADGAVIRTRVKNAGLLRRLGERDDRWPRGDAIVLRDRDLAALETHRHDIIALFVLR